MPSLKFHCVDIHALYDTPEDWIAQVVSLAGRAAKAVRLTGKSTDCREPASATGMTYGVVTGDLIAEHLPWLTRFYKIHLAKFLSNTMARPVAPCQNDRYGININVVNGLHGRYEWHVDPSPLAAILFATTHDIGTGGELALRSADQLTRIHPRPGLIAIFEGGTIEHAVLPLATNTTRISIPMLYYDNTEVQPFPQELDDYLYGN